MRASPPILGCGPGGAERLFGAPGEGAERGSAEALLAPSIAKTGLWSPALCPEGTVSLGQRHCRSRPGRPGSGPRSHRQAGAGSWVEYLARRRDAGQWHRGRAASCPAPFVLMTLVVLAAPFVVMTNPPGSAVGLAGPRQASWRTGPPNQSAWPGPVSSASGRWPAPGGAGRCPNVAAVVSPTW